MAVVSCWPTPTVIVVASYDGVVSNAPWLLNTTTLTFVVYQRKYPQQPNYVPNIGFEGGVFLRFVVDNYDDLPERTAFVQEQSEMHNRAWLEWAQCLLPSATFVPLVYVRILCVCTTSHACSDVQSFSLALVCVSCVPKPLRSQHVTFVR